MMFGMCKTKHSSEDCNRCLLKYAQLNRCLVKQTFSHVVGEPANSLIINFERVIEPFLVLNISLFSYQWLIALFTKVLLRLTVYYYYVTYPSEGVFRSCSVNKEFLEISQNSQENACAGVSFLKKRLRHRWFPVNFGKFLRTSFLTEHHRWLLLAFQSESTPYISELLARNRRNN